METVHEIDLQTMIPSANRKDRPVTDSNRKQKTTFSNGELTITAPGDLECMQTTESYSFLLRIDITSKTTGSNIRLYYKEGRIILNWKIKTTYGYTIYLRAKVPDILYGGGRVPENEYIDIAWIIDMNEILVLVNEELRHIGDEYPYMTSLLDINFELGLIHGDMSLKNTIINGDKIFLIDFGGAGAGIVPFQEFIWIERNTEKEFEIFQEAYRISNETFKYNERVYYILAMLSEFDRLRWATYHGIDAPWHVPNTKRSFNNFINVKNNILF